MQGSWWLGVQVQGSWWLGVRVQDSWWLGVRVQGSWWLGVQVQGSWWLGVQVQGRWWLGVRVQGSWWLGVRVQGSWWLGVRVQGSWWVGVRVQGSWWLGVGSCTHQHGDAAQGAEWQCLDPASIQQHGGCLARAVHDTGGCYSCGTRGLQHDHQHRPEGGGGAQRVSYLTQALLKHEHRCVCGGGVGEGV